MKLKVWQKNILSALTILVGGFVLFNVAFLLAFIVYRIYGIVIMSIMDNGDNARAIHFSWHYFYIIIVFILSWIILRRQFTALVKATFFTMPLIVVLTEVGIQFYQWPFLVWGVSIFIIGTVFLYLYKMKCSWLYYFATIYVVAVELFVMISGMEI